MHFDLTVSLGNIIAIGTIVAAFLTIDRRLTHYSVEHEMLMGWYCREHGITPDELPTRSQ
jgi:hypothetical protein